MALDKTKDKKEKNLNFGFCNQESQTETANEEKNYLKQKTPREENQTFKRPMQSLSFPEYILLNNIDFRIIYASHVVKLKRNGQFLHLNSTILPALSDKVIRDYFRFCSLPWPAYLEILGFLLQDISITQNLASIIWR